LNFQKAFSYNLQINLSFPLLQVQDMLNPEIFCNEYRGADGSWHTARFQDEIEEQVAPDAEVRYGDRRPYVVIPIPGESSWITDAVNKEAESSLAAIGISATATTATAAKRPREDVVDDVSMSMMITDATTEADGEAMVDSAASQEAARHRTYETTAAAAPVGDAAAATTSPAAAPPSFVPGSCMVYLYSSDDNVKLNDIVEVVGIVSRTPELAAAHLAASSASGAEPGSLLDQEMLAAHPPTSQVPRIHAIFINKEDPASFSKYPATATTTTEEQTPSDIDMAAARARIVGFLSMVLGGDNLTAEYLLLQLVASVHHRSKDGAVGVFPLNITSCPASETTATATTTKSPMSPLGEAITTALDALVPRCLPLPLTLEKLNTAYVLWCPSNCCWNTACR
jgi:Mini-chromosome maintenance replisome factor